MKRQISLIAMSVAVLVVQGCSMNMFGSSRPQPVQAAPVQAAGAAPVAAVDTTPPDEYALATFDANHDGELSKDELEAGLKALYVKMDTSADGFLSASEVRPINDKLLAIQGGSPIIDWNADGKIDMTEFASQWRTKFERSDVNSDGTLDSREMAGRAKARKPRELPPAELGKYRGKTS
jgi:Ca2+-binding EF-hand superfamily protein